MLKTWHQDAPIQSFMDDSLTDFMGSVDLNDFIEGDDEDEAKFNPYEVFPRGDFQAMFFLVLASRGQGKNITMQVLSTVQKARVAWLRMMGYNVNYTIFSNYHDTTADMQSPDLVLQMMGFNKGIRNGLVKIDELLQAVKSINTVSTYTQNFVEFVTQMRKRDIDIIAATQKPRRVPDDILDQVDFTLHPQKIGDGRSMRLRIWDLHGQYFPWTFGRKSRFPHKDEYDKAFHLSHVDNVWGTYNTKETIPNIRNANLRRRILAEEWGITLEDDE